MYGVQHSSIWESLLEVTLRSASALPSRKFMGPPWLRMKEHSRFAQITVRVGRDVREFAVKSVCIAEL